MDLNSTGICTPRGQVQEPNVTSLLNQNFAPLHEIGLNERLTGSNKLCSLRLFQPFVAMEKQNG
jgi:hypothetical protein